MLQFNVVWWIHSRREIVLTIQSDNGKQGYQVGGKKYCRPKVVPFPAALAADMAAIGFEDARNPELAAWGGEEEDDYQQWHATATGGN